MKRPSARKARIAPVRLQDLPAEVQGYTKDANDAVAQAERDEFEIGETYNRLVAAKAARKAGLKSPKAFWDLFVEGDVQSSQAAMLGRLAKTFSRETVLRYHPTSLDELISSCKRQHVAPWPDPGQQPVHVPQADGSFVDKPFGECSRDELRAAKSGKPPKGKVQPPAATPLPKLAAGLIDYVLGTLNPVLTDDVPTSLTGEVHGDDVWFSLQRIPSAQIVDIAAAFHEGVRKYQDWKNYPPSDEDDDIVARRG